jgi:hypothetical protein
LLFDPDHLPGVATFATHRSVCALCEGEIAGGDVIVKVDSGAWAHDVCESVWIY